MPTLAELIAAETPLLGYWRLNESAGPTLVDSSGNARNGSYVGSPTFQAAGLDSSEPANKAVNFPSNTAYATIPHSTAYSVVPFSVHGLVASTVASSFLVARDSEAGDGTQRYFRFGFNAQGKVIGAHVRSGVGYNAFTAQAFNDGLKHHIVMTISASNLMRLFVDGRLLGMRLITGAWPGGSQRLMLSRGEVSNASIAGPADEIAIHGKLLTAATIRAMAQEALGAVRAHNYGSVLLELDGDNATSNLLLFLRNPDEAHRALDSGPGARTVTVTNAVTTDAPITLAADGRPYRFTASSHQVDVASSAMPSNFTISAVIKPNAIPGGTRVMRIMDRDNGGAARIFQYRIEPSGQINFFAWLGGNIRGVASTTIAEAGKTYHVAVTWDGTTLRHYVNGTLENTNVTSGAVATGTVPWRVGNSNGADTAANSWFDGWIQNPSVSSRALTASEVMSLAAQAVVIANSASLVATATLSAATAVERTATAALTATTALAAVANIPFAAHWAGAANLLARGRGYTPGEHLGAAAIVGQANLWVEGFNAGRDSASLRSRATMVLVDSVVTSPPRHYGIADVVASAAVDATGSLGVEVLGVAEVAAAATVFVDGRVGELVTGVAELSGQASISVALQAAEGAALVGMATVFADGLTARGVTTGLGEIQLIGRALGRFNGARQVEFLPEPYWCYSYTWESGSGWGWRWAPCPRSSRPPLNLLGRARLEPFGYKEFDAALRGRATLDARTSQFNVISPPIALFGSSFTLGRGDTLSGVVGRASLVANATLVALGIQVWIPRLKRWDSELQQWVRQGTRVQHDGQWRKVQARVWTGSNWEVR